MAAAAPTTRETRRFSARLPRPLWIGLATVGVAVFGAVAPAVTFAEAITESEALEQIVRLGSKVTDAGLNELKQLLNLTTLGLGGPNITDAGLRKLQELAGLKVLRLYRTGVTSAGFAELKRAMPGLTIEK